MVLMLLNSLEAFNCTRTSENGDSIMPKKSLRLRPNFFQRYWTGDSNAI